LDHQNWFKMFVEVTVSLALNPVICPFRSQYSSTGNVGGRV
jgi:hypothetical protein